MTNVPSASHAPSATEAMPATPQPIFSAYLFGPFRVFRDGRPLDLAAKRRAKPLQLLTIFLLSGGRPMSMDELIERCFPDAPTDKATSSFHVTMHSLRRMLEPDLGARATSSFIRRSNTNFYRLETGAAWWTDTGEVERLFQLARANDHRANDSLATFYYSRVAAYCVRRFLEDEPEDLWLQPHRRRYEGMYVEALTRLIQLHIACRNRDETYEYSHQLLRLDPANAVAISAIDETRGMPGTVVDCPVDQAAGREAVATLRG